MATVPMMKRREMEVEAAELTMLRCLLEATRMDKTKGEHKRDDAHTSAWEQSWKGQTRWLSHALRSDHGEYAGRRMLGTATPAMRERRKPKRGSGM